MKLSKGLKQFLLKTTIFLILFVIASGIIGPWVISTRLLYGFHFFIYGGLGRLVLFSAIAFILLTRKKLLKIKGFEYKKLNLIYLILAFLLIPIFFKTAKMLLGYSTFSSNLPLSLLTHLIIVLIPIFIALSAFGLKFIKYLIKQFKKELLICLIISIIFYLAMFYVWQLWPIFSFLVLRIVHFLLTLSFPNVNIIPPRTLMVKGFAANIEQACSGIYSIFLFTALYILISCLDWEILNKKKVILMFFPATIGLFFVNCLRIYLLMLVGIFISPQLALKLFHTYASMILFVVYFGLFWRLFYKWMKK